MNSKLLLFTTITAFSALSFSQVSAQAGYKIQGNIQGFNDPYIYLAHPVADSFKIDSAAVTNGKFSFQGSVSEPSQGSIMNKERNKGFSIFLENSNITVTGTADSLRNVKITGSGIQDDANKLKSLSAGIQQKEAELYAKYQDAAAKKDSASQKLYESQFDSLDKANTQLVKQFIKDNPKSYLDASLLQQMAYSTDYTELSSLYNGLDATVKNSKAGKKLGDQLSLMDKIQDGKPAIAFTQNDTSGKAVNLSDFKGKYVLVDFWASWCGPCRAENPNVVKAYNKYKDKNFTILGVSLDQSADKWKEAINKDNLTWTEVSDLKYWKNEAAAKYGVQAIPANFLIDPNGVIVGHNLRGEDLDNKLAELLK